MEMFVFFFGGGAFLVGFEIWMDCGRRKIYIMYNILIKYIYIYIYMYIYIHY